MLKKKLKINFLIVVVFLMLSFLVIVPEKSFSSENKNEVRELSHLQPSYTSMSPIYINDTNPLCNWSKTVADNEWCTGNGTWSDPYVIEGFTFVSISHLNSAISIQNSQAPFIIRDCLFLNCYLRGINVDYVSNGVITENIFINGSSSYLFRHSIDMSYCENVSVVDNMFYYENYHSIYVTHSSMINLHSNQGIESNSNIYLRDVDRSSISGNTFRIYLSSCNYNAIEDNILINTHTGERGGVSLYLTGSDYNNITRNKIYSDFDTLALEGSCDHNIISLNNISGYIGIYFWNGGSFNTITHNFIEYIDDNDAIVGGWDGISIASESVNDSIMFNYISHFSTAVYLARPSNAVHAKYCTVINNTFFEVGECVDYDKADGHIIKNNTCILYHSPVSISGYPIVLFALLPLLIIGISIPIRKKLNY